MFLKEFAKKIYYSPEVSRIRLNIMPWTTRRDRVIYDSAQQLEGMTKLGDVFLYEASRFSGLSEEMVREKCRDTQSINDEWNKKERKRKEDIEEFYEGDSFFFSDVLASKINDEGMGYIGLRKSVGALQSAFKLRDKLGNEYLDYGCGLGGCAVLFGKHEFAVSIADVSDKMLAFSEMRLRNRGLFCKKYNLRKGTLPQEQFAFVTCFDVLEHVPNPVEVMMQIRNALKPGGIVFLYFAFGDAPDNPTHIVKEGTCIKEFGKMGFQEDVGLRDSIMKDRHNFFVFKKE